MNPPLDKLCSRFLCGSPLPTEDLFCKIDLTLENQQQILDQTINRPLVVTYPLSISYQKAFLKNLLSYLEKNNLEICEDFYLAYAQLVAQPEDKNSDYFKHYSIKQKLNDTIISLVEDIHLVSDGTTGLRTWQASLALAEWCLSNKRNLTHKHILELGSGIGLTGLVVSLHCQPKSYHFSDCHPSVLKSLAKNIGINTKEAVLGTLNVEKRLVLEKQIEEGPKLSILNLPWEEIDNSVCKELGTIDVILAADIVYDSSVFGALIQGLKCLSVNCKVKEIIFACTERNPDTLNCFMRKIGESFKIREEGSLAQENFEWSLLPPVKIFKFLQL